MSDSGFDFYVYKIDFHIGIIEYDIGELHINISTYDRIDDLRPLMQKRVYCYDTKDDTMEVATFLQMYALVTAGFKVARVNKQDYGINEALKLFRDSLASFEGGDSRAYAERLNKKIEDNFDREYFSLCRMTGNYYKYEIDGYEFNISNKGKLILTGVPDNPVLIIPSITEDIIYRVTKNNNLSYKVYNFSMLEEVTNFFKGSGAFHFDLSDFDTGNIVSMNEMFEDCCDLRFVDLDNFDMSGVVSCYAPFSNCPRIAKINMRNWRFSGNYSVFASAINGIFKVNSLMPYKIPNWKVDIEGSSMPVMDALVSELL